MKRLIPLLGYLFSYFGIVAQDIHYTQFFNTPLTLNPALTGLTRGDYRIGAAYRGQWTDTSRTLYSAPSLFFDMPIHILNDAIGIGGILKSDIVNTNSLRAFTGCLSVSYIKALGKKNTHQLSGGIQLGYSNKFINATELPFTTQFIGNTHIPTPVNSVNFTATSLSSFSVNAGVLWFGRIDQRISMYAGGSIYNVFSAQAEPASLATQRFLKWNVHTGIDITLGRIVHLLPSFLFNMQPNADELLPGLSIAYDITPAATLTLGSILHTHNFYKKYANINSAALYSSFDFKGFKLGVSYDFPISKTQKLGAIEITAIYIGKKKNSKSIIFCPMF